MEEQLDDKIKKYLEYELLHYAESKKLIEELRGDIIDSSPSPDLGMPGSPNRGNEGQTQKVYKLLSNTAINRLERICGAIDNVVTRLIPVHKEFYDRYYIKYNKENAETKRIKICMDMFIEERTYRKYKNRILKDLARELGYL